MYSKPFIIEFIGNTLRAVWYCVNGTKAVLLFGAVVIP